MTLTKHAAAIVLAALGSASVGLGQTPATGPQGVAPAGEVVVGSGNYSPIVQDLDKAIDLDPRDAKARWALAIASDRRPLSAAGKRPHPWV